jgi:predicted MPP superfamily phosphohydrolase
VLGNHDYGHAWREDHVADHIARIVRDAGITLLRNETQRIDGLAFNGVDDLWSGHADIGKAFTGLQPDESALILNHNPDAVDFEGWAGRSGWIFAGHTHGGQCKPPFLPAPLLPVKNRRYTQGVVGLRPGLSMYISAGVGHLRRARFNMRPEVPIFTLRPA